VKRVWVATLNGGGEVTFKALTSIYNVWAFIGPKNGLPVFFFKVIKNNDVFFVDRRGDVVETIASTQIL